MTRSMGDAVGAAATALVRQNPDVFAIYVTGNGVVPWTAADRALIPAGKPVVTIDQGAAGSPVASAIVRDVEAGAWTIGNAVNRNGWNVLRPTIYLSEGLLARRLLPKFLRRRRMGARLATLAAVGGWQGDMWIALYDGVPALNFPVPPGINVVAKQYTDTAQGGAVDLSVIFDPYWPALPPDPQGAEVIATGTYADGRMIVALTGSDGDIYVTEQSSPGSGWPGIGADGPVGGSAPVAVGSLAMEFVNDVPSLFCQGDPAKGNGDVFTSWKNPDGSWAAWAKIS